MVLTFPRHPARSAYSAANEEGRIRRTPRRQLAALGAVLAVYVISFGIFYPNVITVADEASYLRQAAAFASGRTLVTRVDAVSGPIDEVVSNYPPGTSALMAPLVRLGGWRAAFALGAVALVGTVLLLVWWLSADERPIGFALIPLLYPPALVISRTAMSDLPSTLIVTAALALFWRARGRVAWMAVAGFLAGASWAIRDTNPLLVAPFCIGAVLRREKGAWMMAVAAIVGGALRLVGSLLVFGRAFHRNPGIFAFSLGAPGRTIGVHLVALMVFVPGGVLFAAMYKGARRAELLTTVALFVAVHLFYDYNAASSGGIKQLILAPRYFCPLVPLLAFAMAESVPRLWSRHVKAPAIRADAVVTVAAIVVACEAAVVNWRHAAWSRGERAIVEALYTGTVPDRPVISNLMLTKKYLNELYERQFGPRVVGDIDSVNVARLDTLLAKNQSVDVALLDRRDSPEWRAAADSNARKLSEWAEGHGFDVLPLSQTPELAGVGTVRVYSVRLHR